MTHPPNPPPSLGHGTCAEFLPVSDPVSYQTFSMQHPPEGFQAANDSNVGKETCLLAAQQHDSGRLSADYSTTGTSKVHEENNK